MNHKLIMDRNIQLKSTAAQPIQPAFRFYFFDCERNTIKKYNRKDPLKK